MYRLPYATEVYRIEDNNPISLLSASELDNVSGFVLAPFIASPQEPIVVIRGEAQRVELNEQKYTLNSKENYDKQSYADDFKCFHEAIKRGQFSKLVLSRCSNVETNQDIDAEALFVNACRQYPRMMIALVKSTIAGTWLMATPEVLLTKHGDTCHTMALAGTMAYDGDREYQWSDKNVAEQAIVADYLLQSLKPLSRDITQSKPYTIRAGNLVHLRTDFAFNTDANTNIGNVVEALHPTPAVCGMPKQEALKFISDYESVERKYYSGYLGPWNINGSISLFVALRCMEIEKNIATMHAGGGILKESTLDNEWHETMMKMEAMRRVLTVHP